MSNRGHGFGEPYVDQLSMMYPANLVHEITNNWRSAPVHGRANSYIHLNEGASDRPIYYVPGFSGGIVANAPFAAEIASQGYEVILPDQDIKGMLVNPRTGHKEAFYTLAMAHLAVLKKAGVERVDVITQSYGSLTFNKMLEINSDEDAERYFTGGHAVLMAPAGVNPHENYRNQLWRLTQSARAESKTKKDFAVAEDDMLAAGLRHLRSNLPRSLRQTFEAASGKLDVGRLLSIGRVSVLSFAEDKLYPGNHIETTMPALIEKGVVWATPVSTALVDKTSRLGRDASHSDHQFNPSRSAAAALELLAA